ncbi:MAG: recombinase family protein, partial [Bacillota bacterium]|nr:recombinase family protein [Bacillota bacterium]
MPVRKKDVSVGTADDAAVIYTRYSSHSQRDVSIEQQLKACRAYAEKLGLRVIEVYADRAMTGTNDKRPEFQRMIKDAAKRQFAYVIVYSLDRFARDRYDSAVYKRELKEYGVRVLSASENISDDPTGVLLESLLEGLAEFYSKELSQKIRRGLDDNAARCMANGSMPYGYRRGQDGRYVVQEAEAQVVREIYSRVAQGDTFASIMDDLNNRGLKTKSGAKWNRSSFNTIITNERYTGVYIYGDVRIEGGIPQILDREIYDVVQYRLISKRNPRNTPQKRRRENGVYLLTGKLYCGKCKTPMIGISGKSNAPQLHTYYICQKRRREKACDKSIVRRDDIERDITIALKEYALRDEVIEWLADCAIEYQSKHSETAEISALKSQLADVKKSIKNLIAAMEQGIISPNTKSRLSELEDEESVLSARITIATEGAALNVTKEQIIELLSSFKDGDVNDKDYQAMMIDTFLVRAYLYEDHKRLVFSYAGKANTIELPLGFDIDTVEES